MDKNRLYFGRKFYQDKQNGYWISCDYPRIRAHRWVWISVHGPIPKGYHIHHKDEDRSNNDIENLELIERGRHQRHHMLQPHRIKFARELAEKYRPLTKAWHASEEGIRWHKINGLKAWSLRESTRLVCKVCDVTFETKTYHQEFCSNACKSRDRRARGVDNIEKACDGCGNKFLSNKYSKQRFCGRRCSPKTPKKPRPKKVCEQCGIEFEVQRKKSRFCGYSCSGRHNALKQADSSTSNLLIKLK